MKNFKAITLLSLATIVMSCGEDDETPPFSTFSFASSLNWPPTSHLFSSEINGSIYALSDRSFSFGNYAMNGDSVIIGEVYEDVFIELNANNGNYLGHLPWSEGVPESISLVVENTNFTNPFNVGADESQTFDNDGSLIKVNKDGVTKYAGQQELWIAEYGDTPNIRKTAVGVDIQNNIYVMLSDVAQGAGVGGTNPNYLDYVVIIKFNEDGEEQWTKSLRSADYSVQKDGSLHCTGLAVSNDGFLYLTLNGNQPGYNGLLMKLDTNDGVEVWRQSPTSGKGVTIEKNPETTDAFSFSAVAVAVDNDDNPWVSYSFKFRNGYGFQDPSQVVRNWYDVTIDFGGNIVEGSNLRNNVGYNMLVKFNAI